MMHNLASAGEVGRPRRWLRRRAAAGRLCRIVATVALLAGCLPVLAHPLGNNTINRQAAIRIAPETVELRYSTDMAEIPTLVQSQAADTDQDGITSAAEWTAYAQAWASEVARELEFELDGKQHAVTLGDPRWSLVPGAAGLFTLRMEALFRMRLDRAVARFGYRDRYKPEQVGWKEIYVAPLDGVTISRANVPQSDRSKGLNEFPDAPGASFPTELSATVDLVMPPLAFRGSQARVPSNEPSAAATVPQATRRTAGAPEAMPASPADAVAAQTDGASISAATENQGLGGTPPATPAADFAQSKDEVAEPASPDRASERQTHATSIWQNAWPFFKLGVHHIATGWDHLAFLLGLLLLRQSLAQLVKVVTAFTLAHSLTLALAANGWVTPPGELIEPAIALTIVYVGFVSLVWRSSRHSVALAFGFGLIHGFGFAGALAESLGTGAKLEGAWLVSLASFNLGIEAFQLLVVCTLVPLMAFAARRAWSGAVARIASMCVLTAGLGWFVARAVLT
jgi:hypothetical protein